MKKLYSLAALLLAALLLISAGCACPCSRPPQPGPSHGAAPIAPSNG